LLFDEIFKQLYELFLYDVNNKRVLSAVVDYALATIVKYGVIGRVSELV